MRIGELARCAGVTAKTVRYYESLGLITPSRLSNGYRDYSDHDVRLVREARALSELGRRISFSAEHHVHGGVVEVTGTCHDDELILDLRSHGRTLRDVRFRRIWPTTE